MAGGAVWVDPQEHGIAVAVDGHRFDVQEVAGGLPLLPELGAGAAPEPGPTGIQRPAVGVLVHVRHHQHGTVVHVLDHGRDQPGAEVRRVDGRLAHAGAARRTGTPRSARYALAWAIDNAPKWKIAAARAASAPPATRAARRCSGSPAP